MLLQNNSSCFVDSCELAFGLSAHVVAARMKAVTPDVDFDTIGYVPSLVTSACLELYGIGLAPIAIIPAIHDKEGNPVKLEGCDGYVTHVSTWFRRPGFRCVIQGPRVTDGEEHANAWNGHYWCDPSRPDVPLEEPNVNARMLWLFTLPKEAPEPEEPDPNDQAEAA